MSALHERGHNLAAPAQTSVGRRQDPLPCLKGRDVPLVEFATAPRIHSSQEQLLDDHGVKERDGQKGRIERDELLGPGAIPIRSYKDVGVEHVLRHAAPSRMISCSLRNPANQRTPSMTSSRNATRSNARSMVSVSVSVPLIR